MSNYLESGKNILKTLVNKGYEAYFIDEAVYSEILEIEPQQISIITGATPDIIKNVFGRENIISTSKEGTIAVEYDGYEFFLNTFRNVEKSRDTKRPLVYHYSKNLNEELACRDFTINAIAMNHAGKLTDAYDGYTDIKKKRIRSVMNPNITFKENPLKIISLARMIGELNLLVDSKTMTAAYRKGKLLADISKEEMLYELQRIYTSKYAKKAFRFLLKIKADKYISIIGPDFKRMAKLRKPEPLDVSLACAFIKAGMFDDVYATLSLDASMLKIITNIATATGGRHNEITDLIVYRNGLDMCLEANKLNVLLKRSKRMDRQIKKIYNQLPIKSTCDLKFKGQDILEITNGKSGPFISEVVEQLEYAVINGQLENDYEKLKIVAVNMLLDMKIIELYKPTNAPDQKTESRPNQYDGYLEGDDLNHNDYIDNPKTAENDFKDCSENDYLDQRGDLDNYTERKLTQMEREIAGYKRILDEKDRQIISLKRQELLRIIERDVNDIVLSDITILRELGYIKRESERILISRELKEVYKNILLNIQSDYIEIKRDGINED